MQAATRAAPLRSIMHQDEMAYAAGTVALELVPERVLIALNARDLLDALTPRDRKP